MRGWVVPVAAVGMLAAMGLGAFAWLASGTRAETAGVDLEADSLEVDRVSDERIAGQADEFDATAESTRASGDAETVPAEPATAFSAETQSVAYEMARGDWPDAEFYAAVEALTQQPELLQALLVEFQGETDSLRLRRLSQLLAETESPMLAETATSMLYSGNEASKAAGMDLLRRIQPTNPAARDVAIDLLSNETDPGQLKSALDIFAKPGVATAEQHRAIINQVAPLASHESPLLRRQSLSILSRWVDDDSQTPIFRAGLVDEDADVRLSAAFAVLDYPFANEPLKDDLLTLVESETIPEVRGAAMRALTSLPLSDEQHQRLEALRQR